jgi:hypothetical protein
MRALRMRGAHFTLKTSEREKNCMCDDVKRPDTLRDVLIVITGTAHTIAV